MEIYFLGYLNAAKVAVENLKKSEYRSLKRSLPHLVMKRKCYHAGQGLRFLVRHRAQHSSGFKSKRKSKTNKITNKQKTLKQINEGVELLVK